MTVKLQRLPESATLSSVVLALNELGQQVVAALSGRLTMRSALRAEWKELVLDGGASDVDVSTFATPAGVFLAYVRNAETGAAIGAAVSLDWAPAAGGIRIRALNGLSSGTRYRVRLLVVEE